ncbi:uncharacterized protein LOC142342052 isoform X2 [Convolutriloba macropyga]|uniref:uncharacterized protein LOC142342052 isoform X2 n=1 Tax=Convolutriloba macropyga TaxID=536237 RepID=UPI003F51B4B4
MAAAYSDDEIDELTCSVCFDLFTDPRMLNCGHSFCTGCLDQIIRNHQKSCPDCRQPLAENLESSHHIPRNYALKKAVVRKKEETKKQQSLAITSGQTDEIKDGNCTKHKKPKNFFCKGPHCEVTICQECWALNHIGKAEHEVVPIMTAIIEVRHAADKNTQKLLEYQDSTNLAAKKTTLMKSFIDELAQKLFKTVEFQLQFATNNSYCSLDSYKKEFLKKLSSQDKDFEKIGNEAALLAAAVQRARQNLKDLCTSIGGVTLKCNFDTDLTSHRGITSDICQFPKVGKSGKLKSLRNSTPSTTLMEQIDIVPRVFDPTSGQIFFTESNQVSVFGQNLKFNRKFTIDNDRLFKRTIEDIAFSGSGTMYVLLKSSSLWSISVLNNATGQFLRKIQSIESTKVSKCKIFAVQNRLFIVEKSTYSGLNSVCVKLYEDELLCKSVRTAAQSVYDVIVTSHYIIQLWGAEKITIKSTENDESFDRVVFLDGVNAIYDTVWVPDISCRTSGYLFVSYYHNLLRMKVFHVDLDNVNNHEILQSLLDDTSFRFTQDGSK